MRLAYRGSLSVKAYITDTALIASARVVMRSIMPRETPSASWIVECHCCFLHVCELDVLWLYNDIDTLMRGAGDAFVLYLFLAAGHSRVQPLIGAASQHYYY